MTAEQKEIVKLKRELKEEQLKGYLKKGSRHLLLERQQVFRFIKDHHHKFGVEMMCKAFKVSKSGYYEWLHRKPSHMELERQHIKEEIRMVNRQSNGRYGCQ